MSPEPDTSPGIRFEQVSDEDLMDYCVQGSEAAFADLPPEQSIVPGPALTTDWGSL